MRAKSYFGNECVKRWWSLKRLVISLTYSIFRFAV